MFSSLTRIMRTHGLSATDSWFNRIYSNYLNDNPSWNKQFSSELLNYCLFYFAHSNLSIDSIPVTISQHKTAHIFEVVCITDIENSVNKQDISTSQTLLLDLTDGHNIYQAVEQVYCPILRQNDLIGKKVLITGVSINPSASMILLQPEQITVLSS
ncbi:hypothetical protein RCL1_000238 [Eukaryota sp. TZLM3-RCL]